MNRKFPQLRSTIHPTRPIGVPARRQGTVARARRQGGVALIEALVAVVVFSIGILGIVGMQARSVQMLSESGFRSQAAQMASELIAEMWTVDPSLRQQLYSSATAGARYAQWVTRLTSGVYALPGVTAAPPTVTVVTSQVPLLMPGAGNFWVSDVTVTIQWQRAGSVLNQYVTTARILEPQS